MIKAEGRFFIFLVGVAAVTVATWAAVFSVTGLSMLYSGSLIYVAIAMGVLEFSKIIVASYLYRHWQDTTWWLKTYLTTALVLLMLITSGGIYGYLTNSYQGATIGLDRINSQTQVLDQRKLNLTADRERIAGDIAILRQERQSTIENRNNEIAANNMALDSNSVKFRAWRNSQVHKRYNAELTRIDNNVSQYTENLDSTNVRLSGINDNISDKKLELINTGVEVGPLLYMARIFNTSMDNVMKWFTLAIVFVFDPLAIALILALNVIVAKRQTQSITVTNTTPESRVSVYVAEDDDEIKKAIDSIDVDDEEFDLGEPDDLSFLAKDDPANPVYKAKPLEQAFDDIEKRIKKRPRFSKPNPTKDFKPLADLVGDIKEKPTKEIVVPNSDILEDDVSAKAGYYDKHFGIETYWRDYNFSPKPKIEHDEVDDIVKLEEDFAEILNETTKKVGQEEPTKERIVLEPAKSGDISKEKIVEAVSKVTHQNEFFDDIDCPEPNDNLKMAAERYEKFTNNYNFSPRPEIEYEEVGDGEIDIDFEDVVKDEYKEYYPDAEINDPEEQYNTEIQYKEPLSNEEITETFEDAAREARKNQVGKISKVIYEPGGMVTIDHSINE